MHWGPLLWFKLRNLLPCEKIWLKEIRLPSGIKELFWGACHTQVGDKDNSARGRSHGEKNGQSPFGGRTDRIC